jgi:hypothetical protein
MIRRCGASAVAVLMAGCLLVPPAAVSAAEVTFTFTKPTGNATVDMKFVPGPDASAAITAAMSDIEKRNEIQRQLEAKGYTCTRIGDGGLKISGLTEGTEVSFIPGGTGERKDKQTARNPRTGAISFGNVFYNPVGATGQPALFTGGIVTSLGGFSTELSAMELSGTSGPIIAQALFQRLAPQAPAFGAHLSLLGDMIEARFDPNVAENAGMVYGTTSLSSGLSASITLVPEPSALAALAMGPVFLARCRRRSRAS